MKQLIEAVREKLTWNDEVELLGISRTLLDIIEKQSEALARIEPHDANHTTTSRTKSFLAREALAETKARLEKLK